MIEELNDSHIEDMQTKLKDNFCWVDDEEAEGVPLAGSDAIQDMMNCVYELVTFVESEISLQYFQGTSFNIPVSIFTNDFLTSCFDASHSYESRAVCLECLYAAFAGIANTNEFKNAIDEKVIALLPCEDTKFRFQVDSIMLADNPECPLQDLMEATRATGQSMVIEIDLVTVAIENS